MSVYQAIILSIIEGVTEFLPISSTGHLILASHILAIPQTDSLKTFQIVIQLGAIAAVVSTTYTSLLQKKSLWIPISLAVLPTAIIGATLYKTIKQVLLGNEWVTILSLGIGGIALILFELGIKTKETSQDTNMSSTQAVMIGIGQSLSMIPGVSRSAASIISGMLTGMKREEAVQFSFYLAIPTMILATGYDLIKSASSLSSADLFLMIIGCIVSYMTARITIRWFLHYVSHHTFVSFGIYRIALAVIYAWVIF